MKKLAIIIPCINLWDLFTSPCINSIKTSLKEEDYIIMVIDNGSSDNTETECRRLIEELPNFKYIKNENNIGVSPSWNMGVYDSWKKYDCDTFLIVNNDILFHPHCIDNLLERFGRGDAIMATAIDVSGELSAPFDIFKNPDKGDSEAPHPHFSCFMFDRKLIEKVGWFDEGFFPAYFEDNDMHYRIVLSGNKAIITTLAQFYHFGSRTQNQTPGGLVNARLFDTIAQYFIRKWGGIPGKEQYKTPFNNAAMPISWTQQGDKYKIEGVVVPSSDNL